ncbi:MAG: hypothetical protein IJS08_10500 [Victivallales bacterium]|nr:hypothetical protein [Victivallales bacterium]
MKNNLEIQEIIGGLRKAFQFHGLPWRPYQYDVLSDGSLKLPLPSDKRAYVICRTVISRPTVEKYRLLLATELKDGAEIVFAATSFTQPFIDSYHEKNIHFYSLNGACRITLPSIITYIVKIQTGSQRQSRNNGGTPFVGKGAMLPRLFFNQPQRIWTLGELANVAAMTKPYASIIVHRMMDNDYVRQEGNGYLLVNPEKMLDDWMAVYRFNRYVRRQMFAASFETLSHGLHIVAKSLKDQNVHFGFMGASGAYLRAPYMESRTVMAYVEQIPDNLSGLFPVESDGNVILYIPQNTGFFFGGKEVDGLPVVSDVQLYLDLKRMPGRNADQADYLRDSLLNWSKQHA